MSLRPVADNPGTCVGGLGAIIAGHPGAELHLQIDLRGATAVKGSTVYDPVEMSNESENDDAGVPPVSAEAAKQIAAEHLASACLARALGSATVEFGVGGFYGAPAEPVWLVRPRSSSDRVGCSLVIAVCPWTGQVLYRRRAGE